MMWVWLNLKTIQIYVMKLATDFYIQKNYLQVYKDL